MVEIGEYQGTETCAKIIAKGSTVVTCCQSSFMAETIVVELATDFMTTKLHGNALTNHGIITSYLSHGYREIHRV